MKRILTLIFALSLIAISTVSAFAEPEEQMPRLTDKAGLISSSEEAAINTTLDNLSEYHGVDICIRTVESTMDKTPSQYADNYFDRHYGTDGVMLLIAMEDRDWIISTCGTGIEAFTDYGISEVGDSITPYLSSGDYSGAFNEFATQADRLYSLYEQGQPLDVPKQADTDTGFDYMTAILTSIVIGLVFALLITGRQKATLKSVRKRISATEYTVEESFRLTDSRDIFQYRTVNRVPKPKPQDSGMGGSSVHMSDGGVLHGGGGGKF